GLFNSLIIMCAFICRQYAIPPTQLYGHRDFWDTACPGDKLYALLPTLRAQVSRVMATTQHPSPAQPARPTQPAQPDLRKLAAYRSYYLPSWPLLRIDDQGPAVLAAQYLLRAAGITQVPTDGKFGRQMADGVYQFQRQRQLPVNGMIGGGSWPLLAVPVKAGQGGNAELAVQVLAKGRVGGAARLPSTINRTTWQQLLDGAAPA
ncbi:MAG TPA: N-acetylmuramoyl-L-alanine amidase, partial [Pseudonocardia sp.]